MEIPTESGKKNYHKGSQVAAKSHRGGRIPIFQYIQYLTGQSSKQLSLNLILNLL